MRVGLIGQVRRVWAPRGFKVVQAVEYTYEWMYLALIVNPFTGRLRWGWSPNMKAASLAPMLQSWAPRGLRMVVWDRAPGHRGAAYQGQSVNRIEQPAYSPELNPTERIFEFLRDKIEGKVYGSMEAKMAAVEEELQHLAADRRQVRQLTCWDWIQKAVEKL
jgi:transposase